MIPVTSKQLTQLLIRIADGTITHATAKQIFNELWDAGLKASNTADHVEQVFRVATSTNNTADSEPT